MVAGLSAVIVVIKPPLLGGEETISVRGDHHQNGPAIPALQRLSRQGSTFPAGSPGPPRVPAEERQKDQTTTRLSLKRMPPAAGAPPRAARRLSSDCSGGLNGSRWSSRSSGSS